MVIQQLRLATVRGSRDPKLAQDLPGMVGAPVINNLLVPLILPDNSLSVVLRNGSEMPAAFDWYLPKIVIK